LGQRDNSRLKMKKLFPNCSLDHRHAALTRVFYTGFTLTASRSL
jgi:hypothetical protein